MQHLLNDLEALADTPDQQRAVALLAEAIENTSLSHVASDVTSVENMVDSMLERVTAIEECLASSNPHPSIVGAKDGSYRRHLQELRALQALDVRRAWNTPSEREKRKRQLETRLLAAQAAQVHLQDAWRKAHDHYAQAEALRTVIREDDETSDLESKDDKVHSVSSCNIITITTTIAIITIIVIVIAIVVITIVIIIIIVVTITNIICHFSSSSSSPHHRHHHRHHHHRHHYITIIPIIIITS